MDVREEYKIRESINDVIRILDSAEIRPDLSPDTVIVQITNRAPIAHLAIERGLKALIAQCKPYEDGHSLSRLYNDLRECDSDCADFLSEAFCDAVEFYGYNVKSKGFRQFQSLKDYFIKVGGEKAFELLRYWAIGESPSGENPIGLISPPIHRELLCALSCLFQQNGRETVTARVECEVANKVTETREFSEITNDNLRHVSFPRYRKWLDRNHGTYRYALKKAFRSDFEAEGENLFWSMNLRSAYDELRESEDPAVRYFVGTYSYLPKGTQIWDPYATPRVRWLDDLRRRGFVMTPACYGLGHIERYADGAWAITPSEPGLVRVTAITEDLKDAKHYLVNRLTSKFPFIVNGKPKQLRIVGEPRIAGNADWTSDIDIQEKATIKLRLWDNKHGLLPEDQVSFEFLPKRRTFKRHYEGSVTRVEDQRVTLVGTEVHT